MKVLIETSARHVHVSNEDLKTLFGENHNLCKRKDLSQPGQYVCTERVTIEGPKKIYSKCFHNRTYKETYSS